MDMQKPASRLAGTTLASGDRRDQLAALPSNSIGAPGGDPKRAGEPGERALTIRRNVRLLQCPPGWYL